MKKIILLLASFIVVFSPMAFMGAEASAASSTSVATNGYKVSPVRTDLSVKPGDSDIVTVYVQNASSAVENVQVIVNDFQAPTDESGNPW